MNYAIFKKSIIEAAKEKASDFYFSETAFFYYANYKPYYPDKSNGDFVISYNHFGGKIEMFADTASVPIIKEYGNFDELLNDLKNMD